jgi:hypothetical protein
MRKRLIIALVALASCGAIAATPAAAVEYANHVEVAGGGNHFGPYVYFYAAETFPWGTAIACAGVRGVGLSCAAKSGENAAIVLPFDVEAEPYIHNHSTWTSYFNGYYYK